jgi:trigger factor
MQVETSQTTDILTQIQVTLEPQEVDSVWNTVLKQVRKQARIPGFRPGKAPARVVLSHYRDIVDARSLEAVLDEYVPKAIKDADLNPVGSPRLNDENPQVTPGETFAFTLECDVMPTITPEGYKDLEIETDEDPVNDQDISERIAAIQKRHAESVPVEDRCAEIGDRVEFSYFGAAGDEEISEDAPMNAVTDLGETELVPELQDHLVGAELANAQDVEFQYPDDFPEENLRGKTAKLNVTVTKIQKIEYPEIDDDLAKSEGFETLDELTEAVRGHLTQHRASEARNGRIEKLHDALLEANSFEVPQAMIDNYAKSLTQYMGQSMLMKGVPRETAQQMMMESSEETLTTAGRQVRVEHILTEIRKRENIEVLEEDVDAAIEQEAKDFNSPAPKIRARYHKEEEMERLRNRIMRDKVLRLLLKEPTLAEEVKANAPEQEVEAEIEPVQEEESAVSTDPQDDGSVDSEPNASEETTEITE